MAVIVISVTITAGVIAALSLLLPTCEVCCKAEIDGNIITTSADVVCWFTDTPRCGCDPTTGKAYAYCEDRRRLHIITGEQSYEFPAEDLPETTSCIANSECLHMLLDHDITNTDPEERCIEFDCSSETLELYINAQNELYGPLCIEGQCTECAVTSSQPTTVPTQLPSVQPTKSPSADPTKSPSADPTKSPSTDPTTSPSADPTKSPSTDPTKSPSADPTESPTNDPTKVPSTEPTKIPTADPITEPTRSPTSDPTDLPTSDPSRDPTRSPTSVPTADPTVFPAVDPTSSPTPNCESINCSVCEECCPSDHDSNHLSSANTNIGIKDNYQNRINLLKPMVTNKDNATSTSSYTYVVLLVSIIIIGSLLYLIVTLYITYIRSVKRKTKSHGFSIAKQIDESDGTDSEDAY